MSTFYQLDFEKPITKLEQRIESLQRELAQVTSDVERVSSIPYSQQPVPAEPGQADALDAELNELQGERDDLLRETYANLGAWETVRVARHPNRPQTRDYVGMFCKDFCELHGDRRFGDDPAIVTGFARIGSFKCLIVGHQKGKTTKEKIDCHFGCAHPEGYRKALAKMKLAEKFRLPIVTFIDTPGAYPGIGAEERGQAEAIAVNLREMARLRTPVVSVVIGEGGSGGALGIGVADRVAMLQHSWYSVISPEGCAAILWKQANEQTNSAAAKALRLTSKDNLDLGIIDDIIPEPVGGAHRSPEKVAASLERWIVSQLEELRRHKPEALINLRYERFRRLGAYEEQAPVVEPPADAGETDEPAAGPGSSEA